jgi:hypothetical protein
VNTAFRKANTYCLVIIVFALLGLAGCESPGSVGSDLGESKADVVIDTLSGSNFTNMGTRSFNFYSGDFQFISAGQFDDPLYGNLKATALIKPTLPIVAEDSLTPNSQMSMRLSFDGSRVYGDSLANQTFDVYEIDELWRSESFKIYDDIQLDEANGPITSFTLGAEDSLDVPLPDEWVDTYQAYSDTTNADSLYERDVFGLALVPTSESNKIIAANIGTTRFSVINPVDEDTFEVNSDRWAYMLERGSGSTLPQGSVALHSTNEQIVNFNLDLSSLDIQATDVAKAELVFYQNTDLMDQSLQSVSPSAGRPEVQVAQLHLVNSEQLPDNITPGNPIANGIYSTDDEAFHFSFTSQIQNLLTGDGVPEGNEFLITLNPNGIIRSSVIYTNEAPADKQPKLIITSLKNNSN